MGDHVDTLIKRLSDPSMRWYIWEHFGRRIFGNVTRTNQTLAVCDDMICFPVRFSEYLRWWDKSANAPGNRMFDRSEAWDHTNETNPTTSYPYDGFSHDFIGYGGYFTPIELTDGSNRVVVHIVRKYNQILIMNMGYYISGGTKYTISLPVKVLFPPSSLGLTYTTNGSVGSDGVTISSGQYVLFYPDTEPPYGIDTSNGIFSTSPMGSSKSRDYEIYIRSFRWLNVDIPAMYTGIRTRSGAEDLTFLIQGRQVRSENRGGINVSGFDTTLIVTDVYDSDPYCSQGTWAGGKTLFTHYVGWAEDENGLVRFILVSALAYKHTTKKEIRGEVSHTRIHDFDTNETYAISYIKPVTNMYSYGQGGYVASPAAINAFHVPLEWFIGLPDASMFVLVKPDDSVDVRTTPTTAYAWEYNDGYGACNVWSNRAVCFEYLALYTDDTTVSINPKNQSIVRNGSYTWKVGFVAVQMKSFMDRTLSAGKTYACISRLWFDQGGQQSSYYADRIKKYTPKVISSTEWSSLITNIPPFTLNLVGGAPHPNGRYIEFTVTPPNPAPDQTFTVTGVVKSSPSPGASPLPNANVMLVIIDPDTNLAVKTVSVQADSNGNFTISTTAPSTPKQYRILVIARPTA